MPVVFGTRFRYSEGPGTPRKVKAKSEEQDDGEEALEAGPGLDHDDGDVDPGDGTVPGAPLVVGVADRPSGVRRIQGGLSQRYGKGKEPLSPLPPGAHWNIGDGGPDALARAGVHSIGCFYAKPAEGFNRWRCFNRLTGFEHVTYHDLASLTEALEDQSKKWLEKLAPGTRSPWRAGWGNSARTPKAS